MNSNDIVLDRVHRHLRRYPVLGFISRLLCRYRFACRMPSRNRVCPFFYELR